MEVNTGESSSRKHSPFVSLLGFQPRICPPILPHLILIFSDLTKRYYKVAENMLKAK